MTEDALLSLYVTAALAAILIVGLIHRRRTRQFEPARTPDHIFRCEGCFFVYTDDPDVDISRCPQCGGMNQKIDF